MATWGEIFNELSNINDDKKVEFLNSKRRDYLKSISEHTGRNTIAYYSAFLQKNNVSDISINDKDINAFMENLYGLDKKKGLDLILHTPGGEIPATEKIIDYLQDYFDSDIRVIVPQMAMSAGSLISVSSKAIIMGRQSCLGPFDPQINGIACQSLLKEFEQAKEDVKQNPHSLGLWQTIISKYHPTFLISCKQAVDLSNDLAKRLLAKNISDEKNIKNILDLFNDNTNTKIHSRHISKEECKKAGLDIIGLEEDQTLQNDVLTLHHCYMLMFETTSAAKIVENDENKCYMTLIRQ